MKNRIQNLIICAVLALVLVLGACAPMNTVPSMPKPVYPDAGAPAAPMEPLAPAAPAPAEAAPESPYDYYDGSETNPYIGNEEYNPASESGFLNTTTKPLSTFSSDVDTASYANIRRMIDDNMIPQPDAVRIEEMLNYFQYDYPQPRSNEPFSMTAEITDCPWNESTKLMLIGMQARQIDSDRLPPSNLVFLIDVSGSMDEYNKLPLLKQGFKMLTEQLRERDRISIVTYASSDQIVLNGTSGRYKNEILSALDTLTAGGGTNGAAGIQTAYELAQRHFIEGGNNRVILATDGDLNIGMSSESELRRLIQTKRDTGVFLSVMGFGTGNLKDNKMETLADNGNGSYSYIDSALEAKKVLVEEMGGTLFTVAKDVKFQVEFNPAMVKGYRLIGYDNRRLNDEDFANDKKDAGDVGAGHRVTVLYELVDKDSPVASSIGGLKYQTSEPAMNTDEWLTVSVRYKEPSQDNSRLLAYPVNASVYRREMSPTMAFAASVAQVGMLLKQSDYAGTSTYSGILSQLNAIPGLDNDVYKAEFKYMVNKLSRM